MKIIYLEGKFIVKKILLKKKENVIKGRRIVKFQKIQNVKRNAEWYSKYLSVTVSGILQ